MCRISLWSVNTHPSSFYIHLRIVQVQHKVSLSCWAAFVAFLLSFWSCGVNPLKSTNRHNGLGKSLRNFSFDDENNQVVVVVIFPSMQRHNPQPLSRCVASLHQNETEGETPPPPHITRLSELSLHTGCVCTHPFLLHLGHFLHCRYTLSTSNMSARYVAKEN